ncbi:class I histocompatibility antigen, F10 alpha chain-like [Tachysurus ichikawai]
MEKISSVWIWNMLHGLQLNLRLLTPELLLLKKIYLEYICIEWLQKYVSYGGETLERKARPEVSIFHKHSSPLATGFYPEEVMITWQRDGEIMHENVELGETLPNPDGSFQKRSILRVSPEDLQKHN